jgi:hypothetical protein
VTSSYDPEALYVGMDVHQDTISVGVFEPGSDSPVVDKIFLDEPSVRRLVLCLSQRGRLRMCYEAGPTWYELQRLLASLGAVREVIAPSFIPKRPGSGSGPTSAIARRMVRLYRAGELVAMRVPSVAEEAVRDLCRARADLGPWSFVIEVDRRSVVRAVGPKSLGRHRRRASGRRGARSERPRRSRTPSPSVACLKAVHPRAPCRCSLSRGDGSCRSRSASSVR